MKPKYKSPRRLKVKPPKAIPHGKDYDRKKLKKLDKKLIKDILN